MYIYLILLLLLNGCTDSLRTWWEGTPVSRLLFPGPSEVEVKGQRSKIKFCEKSQFLVFFIIISKENIPLTWNFTHIINVSITNKIYGCHGNQGLRSRDRRQNLHLLILKTATKRLDRFFSNLVGMYTRVGKYVSLSPEVEVKGQR